MAGTSDITEHEVSYPRPTRKDIFRWSAPSNALILSAKELEEEGGAWGQLHDKGWMLFSSFEDQYVFLMRSSFYRETDEEYDKRMLEEEMERLDADYYSGDSDW